MPSLQWAMMKTIFKPLLLLLLAWPAAAAPVQVVFEVPSDDASFTQLKADAFANRTMRDKAYLALTDEESLAPCWVAYLNNREVSIKTEGRELAIRSKTTSVATYELTFDPSHFEIDGATQSEFLDFCTRLERGELPKATAQAEQPAGPITAEDAAQTGIEVNIVWEGSPSEGGMPTQITSEDTDIDY